MIQKLQTYWEKIISIGTSPEMPPEKIHRLRISNQLGLICASATFAYGFIFIAWAPLYLVLFVFSETILFLCTIFLSHKKLDLAAPLWLVILICIYVFIFASLLGREVGAHWVLLPILFGIPNLLDLEKLKLLVMYVAFPLLVFWGLEVTDYQLLGPLRVGIIPQSFIAKQYVLNLIMAVFASLVVLYYNYYFFKEKVQALRERETALIHTSRLGKIGYCEVDLRNRKISWSPELKEILGIGKHEDPDIISGFKMIIPEERKQVSERLSKVSKEVGNHHEEFSLIRQNDGKKLIISSIWSVWPHPIGSPIKITGIIKDVTLEREHEKVIKAEKERAIEANFAKSRFLTNMSHEIRTPLNGILGFTDLLLKSDLNLEQRAQIGLIKSSGDTLLALLSDLLDLSKIEAGKLKLEEKTFNFFEVTDLCLQPYKLQAREEGVNFTWELDPKIPEFVISDPVRYRQVLVNLVSNAIKYTQEGSIDLSLRVLEIGEDGETFVLEGEITDTGIGIPQAEQEEIFLAFGQSSKTTVEEFGGTGLGLAIVSELVRMMNGSIQVQSPVFQTPGAEGSRFTFQLSVRKGQSKLTYGNSQELFKRLDLKPFKGNFILVAEDNVVNQILAQKVLEDLGAQVKVVENGKEAVDFVKKYKVDLIMMDIKMPVMNGYEATRQIREILPKLPIIALSANAYKEDKEASLEAGMNGHISKPFLPEHLFKAIEKLNHSPSPL